jgi:hypothetical protein
MLNDINITISISNINQTMSNAKYINYISDAINDLSFLAKVEILQMIIYDIDDEKIVEKGNGTQIKFSDINHETLLKIYNNISKKSESNSKLIL